MIKLKITKTAKKILAFSLSTALIMSFSVTDVSAYNAEQISTANTAENEYTPALSIRTETASGSSISGNASGPAISGNTSGSAIIAPPNNTGTTPDNTGTNNPIYNDTNITNNPTPDNNNNATNTPTPDNNINSTNTPAPDNNTNNPTDTVTTPSIDNTASNNATPAAIGTMLTVGKYTYKVTSKNTVTLKGFATGASKSSVIVKNKITYNGVVYNVTKIGNAAFHNKTGVKTVVIRKNITDIGKNAFNGCKNMTKITIRGAKIIRKKSFLNCTKLKTVNITSTVLATVKKTAFKNIKAKAVINVMNNSTKVLVKATVAATITVNKM